MTVRKHAGKIDPKNIFTAADVFLSACGTLADAAFNKRAKVGTMVIGTLEALSLELYLKTLLLLETKQYRSGHDLLRLFRHLGQQTRTELSSAHEKYMTTVPSFVAQIKESGCNTDLESLLILSRNTFVDFRYPHQLGRRKALFGLQGFTGLVRERILALKPDWKHWERDQ
jgi:hypothetical protein